MLKLLTGTLKFCFLSVFVLVLGSLIQWDGKSLSEQVSLRVNGAQTHPFIARLKKMTQDSIPSSQPAAVEKKPLPQTTKAQKKAEPKAHHKILTSERQKLKDLIRELNHAGPKN